SVKNGSLCSHGFAKYKLSNESSQMIKFKYFFPANQSPQIFANGDLVFISGKYVVENSEPCFTIAYSTLIDNKNPSREFDTTDLPICIPHCMYSVVVNHVPKGVNEFIHFGAEAIEYNSVTSKPDVKMDLTIIYLSQYPRFKYLGPSGLNIKLRSTYFISGLFKFSKKDNNANNSDNQDIDRQPDDDIPDQKVVDLEDDIDLQSETDDLEEVQPKKRRKSTG
ncbi:30773_t:CDS:2, partial [Racocetra persica]